jgi:uncharacterized DUF497 family protein
MRYEWDEEKNRLNQRDHGGFRSPWRRWFLKILTVLSIQNAAIP